MKLGIQLGQIGATATPDAIRTSARAAEDLGYDSVWVIDRLLAPVLSQPSMPIALTKGHRRSIDCSPEDLSKVKDRCEAEGLTVLGLRFTGDKLVPAQRFAFLREELGDAFVAVEIDSSKGNPHGLPAIAHSVLTEHLVDEPGHPTRDALDQVLDLFRTRLLA